MNFKQLAAFREVMLTGSFSDAARNLHRTQPAISAQISGLEHSIGFKLFVRRGARLLPKPEAHYLFEEANGILNRLDTVKRTLESVSDLDTGMLRIISIPGPAVYFVPNLIADFAEARPGLQVTLSSRSSIQAQRSIATQEYDVGLADFGFGVTDESRLINHKIVPLQGLCALPADEPLAQKEVIYAADIKDKPLAVVERNHPIHAQVQNAFETAGIVPNIRFETQFFLPAFTFVERRLSYAIVDPLSAESYQQSNPGTQRIVFRPFLPEVQMAFTLMSPAHRPLSTVAQTFLELLVSRVEGLKEKWGLDLT
ncbi:MAG: LysR family transcriptional regulator [Salaquimonas sp.]